MNNVSIHVFLRSGHIANKELAECNRVFELLYKSTGILLLQYIMLLSSSLLSPRDT